MAMNTADGALYFKKSDNTIITAHDDTIMHIDSSNDAVDIYGALSIGPGNNTTASIAIPAGLSTTDSADQVGKVLEISAYDSANHIYSTQWAAPTTKASFSATTNGAAQRNNYGTLTYNSSTGNFLYTAPHVEDLADAHLNTPSSGTGANSILTWTGTDYQWSAPAATNSISSDNTNITITDNGSDPGYITATVDGTQRAKIDANGIEVSTKVIVDSATVYDHAERPIELEGTSSNITVRSQSLRNSNNAIYVGSNGPVTNFDRYDAIVLDAGGDDAKLSMYHTTGTTPSDTNAETIRLLSDDDSFFVNPLRIGTSAAVNDNSMLSVTGDGGALIVSVACNNSNSSITTGTNIMSINQRINATTNTTVSGELELANVVEVGGGALAVPRVRLVADVDQDSYILGTFSTTDQIVTGTLTAAEVPLLASALGWVPAFGTNDESKIVWNSSEDAIEFTPATATMGLVHTAFRVYAGQKVHITLPQKASSSSASGLTIKVYQHNGDLPAGKTHVGDTALGAFSSFMQDDDAQYTIVSNVATSTTWTNRTLEFTPTADGYASIGVSVSSAVGTKRILLKQPKITNAGIGIGDVIAIQYLLG
jgi:hypothetical protein